MTDPTDIARRHGYHMLRVAEVVQETDDTRSYVLDIPDDLTDLFTYRPGQFCTFRVQVDGDELLRCYSMSSAPAVDDRLTVTVKRVPGGKVSNWLHDHVSAGDELDVMRPAGTFCTRDNDRPVIAFCGGSGVTPVISIAKSVLAETARQVKVLYANRNRESVIFADGFAELAATHSERLVLQHHLDADRGYLAAEDIAAFVGETLDADFYICGPDPFMDLVESTLLAAGVTADRIAIERFGSLVLATPDDGIADKVAGGESVPESITLIVRRAKKIVPYHAGDTVLYSARRAGLQTPFSCEAGVCASCMALLKEGTVAMRNNEALSPSEVEEGWILTCQAVPTSESVVIEFDSF
jgi:3-ketosteroid 9alpha-monooxygenase subunit B